MTIVIVGAVVSIATDVAPKEPSEPFAVMKWMPSFWIGIGPVYVCGGLLSTFTVNCTPGSPVTGPSASAYQPPLSCVPVTENDRFVGADAASVWWNSPLFVLSPTLPAPSSAYTVYCTVPASGVELVQRSVPGSCTRSSTPQVPLFCGLYITSTRATLSGPPLGASSSARARNVTTLLTVAACVSMIVGAVTSGESEYGTKPVSDV